MLVPGLLPSPAVRRLVHALAAAALLVSIDCGGEHGEVAGAGAGIAALGSPPDPAAP
jgi:hypothetical protein